MKESKLNPFDAELLVMIRDITKRKPAVEEQNDGYEITVNNWGCSTREIDAMKNAVAGRAGGRLKDTVVTDTGIVFQMAYDPTEYPEQIRTRLVDPDATAGTRYCRTLLEVDAIQVRRDNVDDLLRFTGGGTMTTPKTPDGRAVYTFADGNGIFIDAPESWFIVREPNGRMIARPERDFNREFEPKGIHTVGNYDGQPARPSITEITDLFNKLFGTNIASRCRKIEEEFNEYKEAVKHAMPTFDDPGRMNAVIDELADLNAVVFHSAAILGIPQRELLEMAYDKVKGRQTNPMYKRAYNCGHCRNYMNEDADGNGHCAVYKWGITYFSPVNECKDFKPLK